jgi:hypothetical protein
MPVPLAADAGADDNPANMPIVPTVLVGAGAGVGAGGRRGIAGGE